MSKTKFSKEDLKDKLDGNELDLSVCNLSKVPVREIVSASLLTDKNVWRKKKPTIT